MGKQKWRVILLLALIVIAITASWKTFTLWSLSDTERQAMLENDPDGYKALVAGSMRLGLDLQGGIHTVVRVKLEDIQKDARKDAVERVKEIIRNRVDPEGVFEPIIQTQGADRIIVDLPGWKDEKRAEQLIGLTARLEFKMLETFENARTVISKIDSLVARKNAEAGGDTALLEQASTVTPDSADELLAELLTDPAATSEVSADTSIDSTEELLAQLLGPDTTGIDSLVGDSEFVDVEQPFSGTLLYAQLNDRTGVYWPEYTFPAYSRKGMEKILAMPEVKRLIPDDMQIAFSTRNSVANNIEVFNLYFLKAEVRFLGKNLEGIRIGSDGTGRPTVDFRLSGRPAAQFANLTGNNIDKPFAIVLDDKVESAPFINSRIRNSGQITLGGGNVDLREEARMLETVLRAGALPAPVEIIEKNLVGPTLGSDSIQKGLNSSLLGLALVIIFIGIYYRLSGVIADIALIFNLFFLLAIMAGLGAT
ncbi:MAG: preprotein translocase subunit SecD, partial [Candidatus Zixiibacteriota bacterium]